MRIGFILMFTLTIAAIGSGFYSNGIQGVISVFSFPVIYILICATVFLWWYDQKSN